MAHVLQDKDGRVRSEPDVIAEPYKGPGPIVAAFGEGAVAHFWMGAVGFVGGFIGAAAAHAPLTKWFDSLRTFAKARYDAGKWGGQTLAATVGHQKGTFDSVSSFAKSSLPQIEGDIAASALSAQEKGWLHSVSEHLRHIPGVDPLLGWMVGGNKQRLETAIMGGGVLGALGFFVLPIFYWGKGYHDANAGKDQFDRAKSEILETRARYEALLKKYAELEVDYEEAKRHEENRPRLKVAKDDTPPKDDFREPEVEHAAREPILPKTGQANAHIVHHGPHHKPDQPHHTTGTSVHAARDHGPAMPELHAAHKQAAHG